MSAMINDANSSGQMTGVCVCAARKKTALCLRTDKINVDLRKKKKNQTIFTETGALNVYRSIFIHALSGEFARFPLRCGLI